MFILYILYEKNCIYGKAFNIFAGGFVGIFTGGFSYFYFYDVQFKKKKLECPGFKNIFNYGDLAGAIIGGF